MNCIFLPEIEKVKFHKNEICHSKAHIEYFLGLRGQEQDMIFFCSTPTG